MASFFTIDDLPALEDDMAGKRVLLRGDLDVPVENGRVAMPRGSNASLPPCLR